MEARLTDVKDQDFALRSGVRPAGEPIHEMLVRVTIDAQCRIHDIAVVSERVPYPDGCEHIAPDYRKLIGHNLSRGFRQTLADLFADTRGCTHITELLGCLPTAAFQTFATLRYAQRDQQHRKPLQLDRCHALETGSETVRRYYPEWYRGAA